MAKISIIVPIYNTAEYLKEALDSIAAQTFEDWEALCIDSSSSDNSRSIVEAFAEKDKRFKLISKKENGISAARNAGITAASGEWVMFVDSDDFISPQYAEELYNAAVASGADIAVNCNIITYYGKGNPRNHDFLKRKLDQGVHDIDAKFIIEASGGTALWNKLYKLSAIKGARVSFPEGLVNEDEYFYYCLMPNLHQAVAANKEPYFYRQREGSIMFKMRKIDRVHLIKIFEGIYKYYKENHLLEKFYLPVVQLRTQINSTPNLKPTFFDLKKSLGRINLDEVKATVRDMRLLKSIRDGSYSSFFVKRVISRIVTTESTDEQKTFKLFGTTVFKKKRKKKTAG